MLRVKSCWFRKALLVRDYPRSQDPLGPCGVYMGVHAGPANIHLSSFLWFFSSLHPGYPYANIYIVKRAILIPLQYFLLLLLLTAIISGYSIVVGAAVYEHMSETSGSALFMINLVRGLKFGLYIGGILATLVSLRAILSLKSHRFFALLFLFLVSAPVFFFGYYGVRNFEAAQVLGDSPEISDLAAGSITTFDGGGIYFEGTEAGRLESVVLYHYGNVEPNPLNEADRNYQVSLIDDENAPRLEYMTSVTYDSLSGEIIVNQRSRYTRDGRALVIHPDDIENSRAALFSHTGVLVNLERTISRLFETLDNYADELSIRYLALILSLLLYLFSSWVFLRLTRWPLINFILAILVNIGGLLLTRVQEVPFIREISSGFLQERALGYIGPVLLSFFALLFLVYNTFLPSVKDWIREIEK
jgi:hypothetical protein